MVDTFVSDSEVLIEVLLFFLLLDELLCPCELGMVQSIFFFLAYAEEGSLRSLASVAATSLAN